MFVAKKLRSQSVSAYLIYMYQVEDLVRAYGLDAERIAREYLPRFNYDEKQLKEVKEWYESLARMMKEEGKEEAGHVQVVQNTLELLEDHHKELLADTDEQEYRAAYYKALPQIVALRTQGKNKEKNEMENCIDALYGATLLRMQGKELSAGTQAALKPISELLRLAEQPPSGFPEGKEMK
jgi:cysteinyl-tRNA synthetase